MYYIHLDHLGSYIALTSPSKKVRQRNWFDPWGNYSEDLNKRFDHGPPVYAAHPNFPLTKRGFTGHEHYPEINIINMNGRLYDPVIGRFFSPDNFVQMPEFSQSYNRYSYCLNNPLKYVDPTGQLYWLPGMDNDGNVTYTSEKGDNLHTFQKQFGVKGKDALAIFKQAGLSTAENASFAAGQAVISGDIVAGVTGSEILQGRWGVMTDNQKAAQLMFGMMYGKARESSLDNGAYAIDANNFIDGFYVPVGGKNFYNVTVPVKGGFIKLDYMSLAPSDVTKGLMYYGFKGGNKPMERTDGSLFYSYSANSAKNPNAINPFVALTLSVPVKYNNLFKISY
jgi:RHS repeat-associated protein